MLVNLGSSHDDVGGPAEGGGDDDDTDCCMPTEFTDSREQSLPL